MPVRSFRVLLSNNLDFPLIRVQHHLCWGEWTPGGWEPPATIPPRTEVGWQSESDGIATGTEGWVKYRIGVPPSVIPGGTPPPPVLTETVYIYWNNPFLSSPFNEEDDTHAKGSVTVSDVTADCDADDTNGGGSTFDPISSFDLLPKGQVRGRPKGASDSDELLLDLPQVPFAPVIISGTVGQIVENAWGRFILRTKGSVRQSLPLNYDTSEGLRPFKLNDTQTSVRAIFAL
jgi:hypothetical protein